MSLINEALKRTRDASFQAGTARPTTGENYRVSAGDDSITLGSRSGTWVSLLVVVMAAVTVLVLSLRVTKPGRSLREAMNPSSETSATDLKPIGAAAPVVVQKPEAVTIPVVTPKAEQTTVAKELPASPPAPVVAPPPEPTKFVLQGVTSGAGSREALVNGSVVREGDDVDGARVVSIESRRVKLQLGDREILLRMP